jgi:monovalent cation:H+ antiporter-2, CPA2 family
MTINLPEDALRDHVVVVGIGRVGQVAAGVLTRLSLPFVAIELDKNRQESCSSDGYPVVFGDAAQPVVLEAAGLEVSRQALEHLGIDSSRIEEIMRDERNRETCR